MSYASVDLHPRVLAAQDKLSDAEREYFERAIAQLQDQGPFHTRVKQLETKTKGGLFALRISPNIQILFTLKGKNKIVILDIVPRKRIDRMFVSALKSLDKQ